MENNVKVMVTCSTKKSVNNIDFDFVGTAVKEITVNRRFLFSLEEIVTSAKEIGTVTIYFREKNIAVLTKDGYKVGENEIVTFQRFGGKIAKEFYSAIDTAVEQLENE